MFNLNYRFYSHPAILPQVVLQCLQFIFISKAKLLSLEVRHSFE